MKRSISARALSIRASLVLAHRRRAIPELRVTGAEVIAELGVPRREPDRVLVGRFLARMTGSVADGEDILQDVLIRAYYSLPELEKISQLRPWLFRIAHNQAVDHSRSYEHRMRDAMDASEEKMESALSADEQLARHEGARSAISRFVELPPLQRCCVILKDVLGHSLQEIAELLDVGVPAIQAALHRGRVRLRELASSVLTSGRYSL